jgi:3-deoxy-D-manno-octulosonic-acid transferase
LIIRLYSLLGFILIPVFVIYQLIRFPRQWRLLGQRFGFAKLPVKHALWIHAASVGEVYAARPLIDKIQASSEQQILLTTFTLTGYERACDILDAKVVVRLLPFDLKVFLSAITSKVTPRCLVLIETELWPNLINLCAQRMIPLVLANARLSDTHWQRYYQFRKLIRPLLQKFAVIAVQSETDAERFAALGVAQEHIVHTGNFKFDIDLTSEQQDLEKVINVDEHRPVWLAASSRDGEEEILIEVHQRILQTLPQALMLLVPRHPQRFDEVARMLEQRQLDYLRRSQNMNIMPHQSILLGDSMGEMPQYCASANVVFMGGSLVDLGAHNPIEAAAQHKPILVGPSVFNFKFVFEQLFKAQAAKQISDANELVDQLIDLLKDKSKSEQMGERAFQVVQQNRGAVEKFVGQLEKIIPAIR